MVEGKTAGLFTEEEKEEIRNLYEKELTQKELANKFGCSQGTISNIIHDKHVE